ncbi:hypothetical protein BLNAU_4063 [Blattamonas nauphoetae]|uniref:Uncharacterized protein n=1 Tax=Blattamonas nauphoetae TaxID=2049346 RepID=A0ABQ9YB29_9EUKA|nr:hypothetical protein BLNAU_4063 [Blattamonas nauphoetae]
MEYAVFRQSLRQMLTEYNTMKTRLEEVEQKVKKNEEESKVQDVFEGEGISRDEHEKLREELHLKSFMLESTQRTLGKETEALKKTVSMLQSTVLEKNRRIGDLETELGNSTSNETRLRQTVSAMEEQARAVLDEISHLRRRAEDVEKKVDNHEGEVRGVVEKEVWLRRRLSEEEERRHELEKDAEAKREELKRVVAELNRERAEKESVLVTLRGLEHSHTVLKERVERDERREREREEQRDERWMRLEDSILRLQHVKPVCSDPVSLERSGMLSEDASAILLRFASSFLLHSEP